MRTVYNQYDSLVRPLYKWLNERGVKFEINTRVIDITFSEIPGQITVTDLILEKPGQSSSIAVKADDLVFVTLGSMTEASSLGDMETAAKLGAKSDGGAWRLWEAIAWNRPEFGTPAAFNSHIDKSKWLSFTLTIQDSLLLHALAGFTGNVPGEGGLLTFPDSAWLASIVIPYQPHFIAQPDDVSVLWDHGLLVNAIGDFVKKPMTDCTGREILTEILGQLHVGGDDARAILEGSICIPCMMPFITSQFLPRDRGDRPQVVPRGSTNLAFMGQFCELLDDVAFTVEYSIRSAQTAVQSLLGLKRSPPPVYKGEFDPRVLFKAFRAPHDLNA